MGTGWSLGALEAGNALEFLACGLGSEAYSLMFNYLDTCPHSSRIQTATLNHHIGRPQKDRVSSLDKRSHIKRFSENSKSPY